MLIFEILPAIALALLFAYLMYLAVAEAATGKNTWIFPAVISAVFFGWSLFTVVKEGVFGFWAVHTMNAWGNQVWFDLLLAVAISMSFMIPEAKKRGMKPMGWVLLTLATGCIGVLAMLARILFLRGRQIEKA